MKKRIIIVSVLLFVVFGGLFGFNFYIKNIFLPNMFANMKPPPAPVAMAVAKAEPVPRLLEGVGTLEAVRQVTIAPEVGGRITGIFFEAGAKVEEGAPILQIGDETDRADLALYQAQARLAGLNFERSKKLVDVASPRSRVDENRSLLDEARANVARTEALIAKKRVAAPFAGVLGIRQVDPGQFLQPGEPIVTLTDLSEMFVNFTLPEQNRADLAAGQTVRLSVDAWPGEVFEAAINAIEPQIGTDTRTIRVQARMPNPEGRLLPGMYARAQVVLVPLEPQVAVPETAVEFSIYGDSLYVVAEGAEKNEKGEPILTVEKTYVKTGRRFDGKVAIVEGLEDGARVATSGQVNLFSGAQVIPAEQDTLAKDRESRKGREGME